VPVLTSRGRWLAGKALIWSRRTVGVRKSAKYYDTSS